MSPRINENGYPEGKPEHSPTIHRQVAYKEIYLKNRDKYPLPFSAYQVHHIDRDKLNGSIKNLYICIKQEHNWIHDEQKKLKKEFQNSKEIDIFLINKRAEGNAKLPITTKTKARRLKKGTSKKVKSYPRNIPSIRQTKRDKSWIIIISFIILTIFGILLWNILSQKEQNIELSGKTNNISNTQIEEFKPFEIQGTKTDIIIINNQDTPINLNITYRIYSKYFNIDSQTSQIFNVEAKSQQSFKVYDNVGCSNAPCSVIIVNYTIN